MKIQFDAVFNSRYLCQPIYSGEGKLLAVELVCRFVSIDNKLLMPTELVLNSLNTQQLTHFLTEQLFWVKEHACWFEENQVVLNIPIEQNLAKIIIENVQIRERLKAYSFIHLCIGESFPLISEGQRNSHLMILKSHFTLWLDDFGSGNANMAPVFDHIFSWVKLDRSFFWELFRGENYTIVLPLLIKNVNRFCRNIVIDGLDSMEYFDSLNKSEVQGMKGRLWPGVEDSALNSLLHKPPQFY